MNPVLVTVKEKKQCYKETLTKQQNKLHTAFHKLCSVNKRRDTTSLWEKHSLLYSGELSTIYTIFHLAHTVPMFEVCERFELAE